MTPFIRHDPTTHVKQFVGLPNSSWLVTRFNEVEAMLHYRVAS